MRRSALKHPLAVLRLQLGLGQKELADRLGRSRRTIQAIELRRLPLSVTVAERICDETGVNFNWLMGGDPDAPIIDERGLPWRREAFLDARGRKLPGARLGRHHTSDLFNLGLARLCTAVVSAAASGNKRGCPKLARDFSQILVNQMRDTEAGRQAVLAEAVERIPAVGRAAIAIKKRLKAFRKLQQQ